MCDVPGVVVGTCILIIGIPPRPPRERGILKYISTIMCSIRGSRWLSFIVLCMDTSFNIMKIASPNPDANEYEMSIKSKPIQSKKLIETSNALERVVSISVSP